MKVEDQANPFPCQFQVSEQLSFVHGDNMLDAFELEHDFILYDYVNPVAAIKMDSLIFHRQRNLALET